jgi:hypothetical protein
MMLRAGFEPAQPLRERISHLGALGQSVDVLQFVEISYDIVSLLGDTCAIFHGFSIAF